MANTTTESAKRYDAKLTTVTLAGIDAMITLAADVDKIYLEKSTINEKMNINADVVPDASDRQKLGLLMIGDGGHGVRMIGNRPIPTPVRHMPTDVGLYNATPFVLRPVANDLSDEERKRYALRLEVEINGRRYYAYYARRINLRGKRVGNYSVTVENGIKTITDFEYTDLNVRPPIPEIPNFNGDYKFDSTAPIVVPANGKYVTANIVYDVDFDANDVQELMNVAKILYNDPGAAIVSEFALCYSVSKEIPVHSAVGSDFTMLEEIGVQAGVFVSTFTNVAMDNGGLTWAVQVGQSSPLPTASVNQVANG